VKVKVRKMEKSAFGEQWSGVTFWYDSMIS